MVEHEIEREMRVGGALDAGRIEADLVGVFQRLRIDDLERIADRPETSSSMSIHWSTTSRSVMTMVPPVMRCPFSVPLVGSSVMRVLIEGRGAVDVAHRRQRAVIVDGKAAHLQRAAELVERGAMAGRRD